MKASWIRDILFRVHVQEMRTARDAVQAANPAAKIEIRCVDVHPIKVSVAVVKHGQEVCFSSQTPRVTGNIPLAMSALLLL